MPSEIVECAVSCCTDLRHGVLICIILGQGSALRIAPCKFHWVLMQLILLVEAHMEIGSVPFRLP
jgi:hypothetical protein